MKLYKLTTQDNTTYDDFKYVINQKYTKPKKDNPQLCTNDIYHAYKDINLAFLLNPIHANIINPRLYECQGEIVISDFSKVGCFDLTLTKEIKPPTWVGRKDEIKVRLLFAVLSAREVLPIFEKKYPNDNRSRLAIEAAENYINNPAARAAEAAEAAWAAGAAAAGAAGGAAGRAAWAAWAAWAAGEAAERAAWAAAERAAWAAAAGEAAERAAWTAGAAKAAWTAGAAKAAWAAKAAAAAGEAGEAGEAAERTAEAAASVAEKGKINFAKLAKKAVMKK
jgi:hypothetical protein